MNEITIKIKYKAGSQFQREFLLGLIPTFFKAICAAWKDKHKKNKIDFKIIDFN